MLYVVVPYREHQDGNDFQEPIATGLTEEAAIKLAKDSFDPEGEFYYDVQSHDDWFGKGLNE